ncbi:ATP-binding protein [Rhodobacter sp. SY28-1]|uniref:ATP-binding protein n=1 Tax=Rhodobacter sp. SY28-1 TaxID=2562317 RepID=UPI0010C061A9|nr:ATP-binding protein [Rhodobacter sp. SY28-1]
MADNAASDDLPCAALLGVFDPNRLIDSNAPDRDARLRAQAAVAIEVPSTVPTPFSADAPVEVRWLWRLTPDGQRMGLAQLPEGAARARLLKKVRAIGGDAMTAAFLLLLEGGERAPNFVRPRGKVPKSEDLPQLLRLMQALELLNSVQVPLEGWAADADLSRSLAQSTVKADKRAASAQILPWTLQGRRAELAALKRFATLGQVSTPPFVPGDMNQTPLPGATPTVILSGLGGSGKSALLEALRRRLAETASILQVTFDLDQPALRAGHRVALTQELMRQIGQARPALDARLSEIRQTLRGGVAMTTEGIDPSREASAVYASLTDLNTLLSADGKDEAIRLVLIFDTFEEALILGPDRVRLIADWIGLVGQHRLSPRVILSGREASSLVQMSLPGLAVEGTLLLGELTVAGGRALLRDQFDRRGIAAGALVPKLVEVFGADPLTLMMLARFAEGIEKAGGDSLGALTDLARGGASEAREQLDGEMRQTFLMSRILNRLPTRELVALASPGLVLRQVTPELIREVLAGPCKLKDGLTLAEAEELFDKLDDMVWLVQRPSGEERVVVHVPALRRRMLPQLLKHETAQAVIAAAVGWYEARAAEGEPGAEYEAMYYRALGDPESLPEDPAVLRALADHLGAAVADLDFAEERFRNALGRVVSRATVETLAPGAARKGARDRRRKFQLSEGLESSVVEEAVAAGEIGESGAPAGATAAGGPMPADLVAARFAALDLAPVAAEAPRLARSLLDGIIASATASAPGEMTSENLQDLSVAALQAATACLEPEVGPGSRAELTGAVQEWLQNGQQRALLMESYGGVLQQSPQLWPAWMGGVLVLSLAGGGALARLGEAVPQAVRGMARSAHSPYAWRALRTAGPLREGDAVKGMALAYLATEVLPLVAASVIRPVDPDKGAEEGDVSQAFRSMLSAQGQVSISDHNRIETILYRQEVTLQDRLPLLAGLPGAVPGRLPEFHGAFRLVLGKEDMPVSAVQSAVSTVARYVPWWPKELRAEAFSQVPFSPTLISSLIDTADRCGRLPDLAAELARPEDSPTACKRLSALIGATVAQYRTAAGVPPG